MSFWDTQDDELIERIIEEEYVIIVEAFYNQYCCNCFKQTKGPHVILCPACSRRMNRNLRIKLRESVLDLYKFDEAMNRPHKPEPLSTTRGIKRRLDNLSRQIKNERDYAEQGSPFGQSISRYSLMNALNEQYMLILKLKKAEQ